MLGVLLGALAAAGAGAETAMPQIIERGGHRALLVEGSPFLMLGVQANNSSNYPAVLPKVWAGVEQLHANTLEIPISWEQFEPQEGSFDHGYLDALLAQARQRHVHLVLLWFATWKNNNPNYAPQWVKLDNQRFPRVIAANGETRNSLSPHFTATLEADRKAFVELMRYLKRADAARTVIMVQVENETGTYGAVRDYSPTAQKLFEQPVPAELIAKLHRKAGTWSAVFGRDADEFFHAWSVARYVEQVAAAGKAEYPLPLYVNAALRDAFKDQAPSSYSSGGPTWNVLDIWRSAAPSLDAIGPDIYDTAYDFYLRTLEQYQRPDNPLFVPETGNKPEFARYCFEVFGRGGIGFSPFGMDFTGYVNFPLGAAKLDEKTLNVFARNYEWMSPVMRQLAEASLAGKIWGAAEPTESHERTLSLGGKWQAVIGFGQQQFGPEPPQGNSPAQGSALIAEIAPDEYLVGGFAARVTFRPAHESDKPFFPARVEEGHYENGRWVFERVWNGDQTDWGLNFTGTPQWLHVKLASYQ
jgi:beta-galactosidase GanA